MSQEPTKAIRRLVQAGIACTPKSYWRAATQRHEVAKFLLKTSNYYLDAIHIAGYAAECSLKALILKRTPESKWAATCEEISSGAKAHNFDYSEGILRRKQCSIPAEIAENLDIIKREWTTNLRYEGALIPHREAQIFIDQVASIEQWVERSM